MQKAQEGESIEMSIPEMKQELERFQTKLSKIGDVNLGAIQEFEELKERFDFLSEQRADLEKAIEDLHKVIRKINRITQQRFTETFDQVNDKLKEVFPKLFEGGIGETGPDRSGQTVGNRCGVYGPPSRQKTDPYEPAIGWREGIVGHRLYLCHLPDPPGLFCLLDEIDAPLDEANIVRFNNLMKVIGKKSQIIMITHNKRSMEFAETLYGVTMEQKGISKIVSVNLNEKHA
jgi:chromosome segregation protein